MSSLKQNISNVYRSNGHSTVHSMHPPSSFNNCQLMGSLVSWKEESQASFLMPFQNFYFEVISDLEKRARIVQRTPFTQIHQFLTFFCHVHSFSPHSLPPASPPSTPPTGLFLSYLRIDSRFHPLILQCIVPKDNYVLLHNHSIVINLRKFNIDKYFYL